MKFIKEFWASAVAIVIFSYLVIMMKGHFHHISQPSEALDEEAAMLRDMKKALPPNAQASFVTNLSDDEASQGAYYQTQFGWCPMVLSDDVSANDNIIFYRSAAVKDSDLNFLHHSDTLYRGSGSGYTLLLLHKTKNK